MPMDDWNPDFGKELPEKDKNKKKQNKDPKDPFGMMSMLNDISDMMNNVNINFESGDDDLDELANSILERLSGIKHLGSMTIRELYEKIEDLLPEGLSILLETLIDDGEDENSTQSSIMSNISEEEFNALEVLENGGRDVAPLLFRTESFENLRVDELKSIGCVLNKNLLEDFTNKYGEDSSKWLDDNFGVVNFFVNEISTQLPLENKDIEKLNIVYNDDEYILCYTIPKDPNKLGFYIAFFQNEDKTFSAFVPEFYNTFKVDRDRKVSLFDKKKDSYAFVQASNGEMKYNRPSLVQVKVAVNWVLDPIKNVMMNPLQFGTITNVRDVIKNDTDMLKIGVIKPHDSAEARLFIQDADLKQNAKNYPFYLRFAEEIDPDSLEEFASIFFKVDWNDVLQTSQLKYDSKGRLFVDIDIFGTRDLYK